MTDLNNLPTTYSPQEAENKWYKIVLMDHVEVEHLTTFIAQLKATMHVEKGITA